MKYTRYFVEFFSIEIKRLRDVDNNNSDGCFKRSEVQMLSKILEINQQRSSEFSGYIKKSEGMQTPSLGMPLHVTFTEELDFLCMLLGEVIIVLTEYHGVEQ